jgi:D-methionine transport system substrate-binding protein
VIGVHVEPFGGYSKKVKNLAELKDGATVAIPNEGSNSGRALILLQKAGLITLKDPKNALATPKDIAENPKNSSSASLNRPCCRACWTRSTWT